MNRISIIRNFRIATGKNAIGKPLENFEDAVELHGVAFGRRRLVWDRWNFEKYIKTIYIYKILSNHTKRPLNNYNIFRLGITWLAGIK